MPIKQAAFKALRQSKVRQLRNQGIKENIKYLLKKARKAIEKKDQKAAGEFVSQSTKAIDKAVHRKVLKKNNGARKKSRLLAVFHRQFSSKS